MSDRPRVGSKATTWDWTFLSSVYDNETYRCYQFTDRQIGFLLPILTPGLWSTRWFNRPANFDIITQFVIDTGLQLSTPIDCTTPPPPPPPPTNCPDLPDWVTWDGENLIINSECGMSIIINNYGCGCGCGCGSGSTGQKPTLPGSDDSLVTQPDYTGGGYPSGVTQCDFATTTIPLILDSIREFVQVIDDNAESLQSAVDAIFELGDSATWVVGDVGNSASGLVTTILAAGSQAILSMLNDNDFRYSVQIAWIKAHGNSGTIITEVSRQDLFEITKYLPNFFNTGGTIVLPKVLFPIFWRIININKINGRLAIAEGTATNGLCNYLYSEANLTYTPPTAGSLPPPTFANAEWGMSYAVSDELGNMTFGNSPAAGWGTYTESVGWQHRAGGTVDMHVACQIEETLEIVGCIIQFASPIPDNGYRVMLYEKGTETIIQQFNPADLTDIFTFELETPTIIDVPMFWTYRTDNNTNPMTIIRVDVYGINTQPSYGIPIAF